MGTGFPKSYWRCYILRALQVQFSCALLSIVNGGYLLLYSLPYFYAFPCSLPAI